MRNQIKFDDNFYNIEEIGYSELKCPKIQNKDLAILLGLEVVIPPNSFDKFGFYNFYKYIHDEYFKIRLDAYQLLCSATITTDSYANPELYQKVFGDEVFGKIQEVLNAN